MAEYPQTIIKLYSIDTDPTYNNVRYFVTEQARTYYYTSANPPIYTFTDTQYVRRNQSIEVPVLFDNLKEVNYCIYNNGEGEGDEYAFVTNIEFVNFNCSRITLMYDVFQNALSKIRTNIPPITGNVIRKMGNPFSYDNLINDYKPLGTITKGLTIPNSDYGFYVFNIDIDSIKSDNKYTLEPYNKPVKAILLPVSVLDTYVEENVKAISNIINTAKNYSTYYISCPFNIYLAIKNSLEPVSFEYNDTDGAVIKFESAYGVQGNTGVCTFSVLDNTGIKFPVNKYDDYKLNMFPYSYYKLCTGSDKIDVSFENLRGTIKDNNLIIHPTYSYSIDDLGIFVKITVPHEYEAIILYDSVSTPVSKYSDVYNDYMATNKYRVATSLAINTAMAYYGLSSTTHLVGGGMVSNPSTALVPYGSGLNSGEHFVGNYNTTQNNPIAGGKALSNIYNTVMNLHEMSLRPLQGSPSGVFSEGYIRFKHGLITIETFSQTDTSKDAILSYYNRNGYYFNNNEIIKFRTRKYYDYIKVNGEIFSNFKIHQDEKDILNTMFNNGVTLWHAFIGDDNRLDYKRYEQYTTNKVNEVI